MAAWLATQGHSVNRKRAQRLMRLMGLVAIYQRPNTSRPAPENKVYPYLLGGLSITRVNQVWCADITYIPMARGFLYLVAIMDWHSRAVLAWQLSNTLGADFCVEALEQALARYGKPEIFNTDQRCYGASGEDKASSSLETTDGVPHAAVARPEQIARRSGSG
jgi:putative transposase